MDYGNTKKTQHQCTKKWQNKRRKEQKGGKKEKTERKKRMKGKRNLPRCGHPAHIMQNPSSDFPGLKKKKKKKRQNNKPVVDCSHYI